MSRVTQVMLAIMKPFNKHDLTRVWPPADFKQAWVLSHRGRNEMEAPSAAVPADPGDERRLKTARS